jgi:hydroxymethylpyrimidine pyrophosphatase-like HAD family hydrolase
LSVTTLTTAETAHALAAALGRELNGRIQIRSCSHDYAIGYWELSVLDIGATKAAAIRALRGACGLLRSTLVVFGDAENDLDMFRQADVRVAVRNAAPELLAFAHHVVESNEGDGVVRWLLSQHFAEMETE